jgi:8-oxo-dGTP pyrophosphatase MutT (NUDIX family)
MLWVGDRLLLLRRSRAVPSPGLWNLPGGHREPHEHPREAAVRELWEETGVKLPTAALRPYKDVQGPRGVYRAYRAVLHAKSPADVALRLDKESDASSWPTRNGALEYPLHPGLPLLLDR